MAVRDELSTAGLRLLLDLWLLRNLWGLFLAAAELAALQEIPEPEAAIVPAHAPVLRPIAPEVVGERVPVLLEHHLERDPAHRPGTADATAHVVPVAPSAHGGFGLIGDLCCPPERDGFPAVERDQGPRRTRRRLA
jgi:hypothetical protein